MRVNLPNLYAQTDARWAGILLGFNSDPKYTLGGWACYITCHAMIATYYGHPINPKEINEAYKNLGAGVAFRPGGGDYVMGGLPKLFPDLSENRTLTPDLITDAQFGEIKTALDKHLPVIIQIDAVPRDSDLDSHFVVVVDYDQADENNLTIADPINGQIRSLKDYLGWFRPSARKTIEQIIIITGKVPEQGVLVPAEQFPNLVHKSTQWDKTVNAYLPEGTDPNHAPYEDLQRVIAGIKSTATTQENRAIEAEKLLAAANTEIKNQKDKVANVEAKCQRELDIKNAEISALNDTIKNGKILTGKYEATITDLEGKLREAQKAGGLKDIQITELKTKLDLCQKGQTSQNCIAKVIGLLLQWIK